MEEHPLHLTSTDILSLLPHRPPILLVDEVFGLLPGRQASAQVYLCPEWELFAGHFPGHPVLPGIYITECMAQAAGVMLLAVPGNRGCLPLLLEVNRMRYLRPALPGDTLRTQVTLAEASGAMYACKASSYIGDCCVAKGQLVLSLKEP